MKVIVAALHKKQTTFFSGRGLDVKGYDKEN